MAANSAEAMSSESIQQQIMASEEDSAAEVLQSSMPASISTTIQTNFTQQNEGITTISTISLPDTITTAEAMVATESISVGTQVVRDSSLSGQEIVDNIPQIHQHESVSVAGTQESIVIPISAENVGIATTNSSEASIQLATLAAVPSNYPWAARLHDCELIGDSYRGYVTNEVELDLIQTLHKQHTNSCWGTRQSPSSAKPSIRLMWKSQYVPYDGIPFLNTGRRATVMECQYGPRRKGAVNKKQLDYNEHGGPMKRHRPTCPARIYVKKVRKFPEFRIDLNLEGKNVRQAQERALTALRLAGVETGGEERYYVQLPLPIAHEYHDIDDIPMGPDDVESQGQRLNPDVMHKIRELVARGVTGIYTVKHCLKEYVEKELFVGLEAPPRHNKSFFPTIIDIQNHIHQAQMAIATGALLPLPPLTNLPTGSPQLKERTRKRKHAPEKLSQSSQTTAQAVASIQPHDESDVQSLSDHEQQQLMHQSGGQMHQGNETHQIEIIHSSEGQTAEVDMSPQPQILITQSSRAGREDGQVVIVVTSNNLFSGQSESETPTTLSLTIPASQVANLSNASLHSGTGPAAVTFIPQQMTSAGQTSGSSTSPQTVTFIPQGLDNSRNAVAFLSSEQASDGSGQVPVSTAYLTTQGQAGNLLTVLDTAAVQASVGGSQPVIRVGPNIGAVQIADGSHIQNAVPGQLLASQAAVEAVLNAATSRIAEHQTTTDVEGIKVEPQSQRASLGVDFASLVKEAVFDGQQVVEESCPEQIKNTADNEHSHLQMLSTTTAVAVQRTENTQLKFSEANGGDNYIPMETESVVMVTQPMPVESGIVHVYEENNHALLGDNTARLPSVGTQLYNAAERMVALSRENVTQQVTKATSSETVQDVVPMETREDHTNEQKVLSDREQSDAQSYGLQTRDSETAGGEQHNLQLMFENGERVTEEEASIDSHSSSAQEHMTLCDNVQILNSGSTVFTQ